MVDLAPVAVPGGSVRMPLASRFAAEVGGEAALAGWLMGHGALRLTLPVSSGGRWPHTAADLELGCGVGRGGENEQLAPRDPEGLVTGAFVGAGFGGHGEVIGAYVRGRAQISRSDDIPQTLWLSGLAGIQVGGNRTRIRLGAGWLHYRNEIDREGGLLVEIGFELGPGQARAGDP